LVKAVIFDVGGVLAYDVWETFLVGSEVGVASTLGLDAHEARKVGQELWHQFAYSPTQSEDGWRKLEKEYWDLFIERFHLSQSADYFVSLTDRFIRPVEGMTLLLESLRANGIKLAICSDNTEFWFRRQMDTLGLEKFFKPDYTIVSCRIGASKSSPGFEMFEAVVAALNIDKKDCVLIDDRSEAILQGVEFGLAGIIFPSHSPHGGRYLRALLAKMGLDFSDEE
jgi:HAD superfamily hydrolase (TIGR01509 family)